MTEAWYLESSALVKLVLAEEETPALRAHLLATPTLVSSTLVVTEVLRACTREAPDQVPFAERLVPTVTALIDLDRDVLRLAGTIGTQSLRSLDAIHLATADRVGPQLAGMITYDARLSEAATGLGMEVVSPGR